MQEYASPSGNFSGTTDQVEDWMHTVANEINQAVAYVDTVIVPEIRRESASAMRLLATQLENWADKLDPAGKRER